MITDADVTKAVGSSMFTIGGGQRRRVLLAGEHRARHFGRAWASPHGGIAAAIWTPSGRLEQQAGRTLTELSIDGNKGFKAYDANACSIYVAKGTDVITWSIQTMNPAMLPDLCDDHRATRRAQSRAYELTLGKLEVLVLR